MSARERGRRQRSGGQRQRSAAQVQVGPVWQDRERPGQLDGHDNRAEAIALAPVTAAEEGAGVAASQAAAGSSASPATGASDLWPPTTGLFLLAVGVMLYLHFIWPQLGRPFVYDEAAFAFMGEAVAKTGLPYANVGHLGYHGNLEQRYNWGLWHPPLYVYTLGLSFLLLGVSEWSARLVGVATNLGAALFVFLAARELLRHPLASPQPPAPSLRVGWAGAAAFLYLTNPLAIQSALLLDIDGTVLVLLLAALLYLCLGVIHATSRRSWLSWCALATVAFALALWAKVTSPWALPAALLLYRLFARRPWQPWRGPLEVAAIAGGGSALFLGSWWLACRLTGMPFAMPFEILWGEFLDATGSTDRWRQRPVLLAEMLAHVMLWVSPYLFALFGWALLRRAGDLAGTRPRLAAQPVDIALLAGGGLTLLYLVKLAGSFPKYHIAMLPMWAVAAGWLLHRYVGRLGALETGAYALALGGLSAYFTNGVKDRWVLFRDWSFVDSLMVVPGALGLAFVAAGPLLRRSNVSRQCVLFLLLLVVAWSYGVNARQAVSPTSTTYFYGTHGVRGAAQLLDQLVGEEEPYVAAKEIAWYAGNKLYLDQDSFNQVLAEHDKQELLWDGSMLDTPIRVVALFIWDPQIGAWYQRHLESLYRLAGQEGSYFVFVRRVG